MSLNYEHEGEYLVVFLSDELDHHRARQLIEDLDRITALHADEPVILDLSQLTFMDSSGLAVAINLYRALKRSGQKLVIRGTPAQPMRVFRAAGLEKMITFINQEGQIQC